MSTRLKLDNLKDVLSLAVRGAPFDALLASMLQAAHALTGPGTQAAFYLVDDADGALHLSAAIGLAPGFTQALRVVPIGAGEAACGRAVATRATVIVEDVLREPRLAPYLDLARAHGIRACWSFPLHGPDGDVLGTLAFYHDAPRVPTADLSADLGYFADMAALLAERHLRERRAERRQAESERRRRLYEAVLSATPDLVYVFDLNHRFTYANAVLLQMWGRTWDEAIGKNCLELGYPDWHAAMHDREIEQVKATRQGIRGVVPFEGTFGLRYYDYIFVPVIGPDGEVEAVAGTTRDVTELKHAEEALVASQQQALGAARAAEAERQRLDAFLQAVPVGITYCNADGGIELVNATTRQLWGRPLAGATPEECVPRGWWADDSPREGQPIGPQDWALARALRGEEVEGDLVEAEPFGPAPQRRRLLLRATAVRDGAGAITGAVVAQIDVTERVRVEAALRDANRRKDEFLAMLAHELRNPLAPISAAAQVLRIAPHDAAKVRNFAELIGRQVNHMTALVNDLLDVSRVTRGVVQFEKDAVDMRSVVASAAEQVHPLVDASRHRLLLDAGAVPAIVLGDRARLIQVVANLLANAAKYTAPGGHLALAVETGAHAVTIRVRDDGSGIEPALLPHIFELFTQGKRTPDRAQGGLGLGLALARTIVAAHDGRIEAHSAGPGQGSCFTVTLPLAAVGHDAPRADAHAGAGRTGAALDIVIVDDNLDAAATLAALLQARGHRVAAFGDPATAVAAASRQPPDAFILDIGMPGMDGHELARRLRQEPALRDAVYIALTGYGQPHDRELSLQAGFDHHLVKPVDADELAGLLVRGVPSVA
ncbi:ATP-binding protein [uncultured Massilia sp.]|uniref:ATP-binding protein n=1 Tax=uncultured Massilia sp. TaxID=169973 RepID=UPI0025F0256D|nr:ATP-binding protein [uncultured Massilia sp.]